MKLTRKNAYIAFLDDFEFIEEWFWTAQIENNSEIYSGWTHHKLSVLRASARFKQIFFVELLRQGAIEPVLIKQKYSGNYISFSYKQCSWDLTAMKHFRRLSDPNQRHLWDMENFSTNKI
jgi:hypothetical protein